MFYEATHVFCGRQLTKTFLNGSFKFVCNISSMKSKFIVCLEISCLIGKRLTFCVKLIPCFGNAYLVEVSRFDLLRHKVNIKLFKRVGIKRHIFSIVLLYICVLNTCVHKFFNVGPNFFHSGTSQEYLLQKKQDSYKTRVTSLTGKFFLDRQLSKMRCLILTDQLQFVVIFVKN